MRNLSIFPQREIEREIDEELEYHIELRTRDNIDAGMSPAAAREEALRRFGNMTAVRRECRKIDSGRLRAVRRAEILSQFKQDIAVACRTLFKRPGFAAIAILTLALGVGGTTAIFSVVDGVVLRPLPYSDPDGLTLLWGVETGMKSGSSGNSYPDYVDIKRAQQSFAGMAAWSSYQLSVTGSQLEPTRVPATWISHNLFPLLGVRPALGRNFTAEEDEIGGPPVVILSYAFWAGRLGSDPTVIGRSIMLDGAPHTVVGVMPPENSFAGAQIFVPLDPDNADNQRGQHNLLVVGRLADGVSMEQAEAEVKAIAARLEEEYPEWNTGRSARLESFQDAVVGDVRPALLMLLGAVGVVLLIVCGNVANLLLARATGREREVAIRTALGAGRARLVRQLLSESLVLALFGGAIGVVLAYGGIGILKSLNPGNIPRLAGVEIDERVLAFGLAVTLVTGLVFGFVPALQGSKPDLQGSLKEGGRTSTASGRRARLRQLLVVAEMALAVVLVAGAGLFLNSFLRLQGVDPGYSAQHVLVVPLAIPTSKYPPDQPKAIVAFYKELVERIESLPGVESASVGYRHPLDGGWETSFQIAGILEAPQGERPEARLRPVTPGYFRTVGIPLIEGRDFTDGDKSEGPGVVIINESFARTFFPDTDPIGRRLIRSMWWPGTPAEFDIVGVVGDVKMDGLTSSTPWAMYYPHAQQPFNDMNLVVRTATDPLALTGAVRQQVWEMDSDVPVENVQNLAQIRAASVAPQRFQTEMLALFAVLALIIAAVGIYGVLSFLVAERTGEIGVRISLGAGAADVLRLVVGQGMRLAAVGLVLGLIGAYATTRVISGLLFAVSPTDPLTFAAVAALLALTALAACAVPALRASRVDPVTALRTE